jgi:thiamine biosynthesis lipoprotein
LANRDDRASHGARDACGPRGEARAADATEASADAELLMFTFRCMNTDVQVFAEGPDSEDLAHRVAATFWQAERRFSRFRPDSELSWLNRQTGPVAVSSELFAMLLRARRYMEPTDGLFDPGVGATLSAQGYDRSFAPGRLDREHAASVPRRGSFVEVALHADRCVVTRPDHVQIDLGGLVKGATVDAAADLLPASGAIDAGGDAVFRGRDSTGEPWLVDVEDPTDAVRTLATLTVSQGAVATSAPNRRRWRVGATTAHHLIDPRTQASATSDLLQATVLAPTAELADVLAKTAYLLGAREGRAFLERQPAVGGLLVPRDGAPQPVGNIEIVEMNHG